MEDKENENVEVDLSYLKLLIGAKKLGDAIKREENEVETISPRIEKARRMALEHGKTMGCIFLDTQNNVVVLGTSSKRMSTFFGINWKEMHKDATKWFSDHGTKLKHAFMFIKDYSDVIPVAVYMNMED